MRAARLQELQEMAAKLLATARELPPGQDHYNALREIGRFCAQIDALQDVDSRPSAAGAEGKGEMSDTLSLSIFTIEADRKPLLAFAAKKYQEVEAFCADERVLTKLRSVKSGGVPLCNDDSILRVRLPTSEERAHYHDRMKQRSSTENLAAVFLVDVDKA